MGASGYFTYFRRSENAINIKTPHDKKSRFDDIFTLDWIDMDALTVVAPSLTPESYNTPPWPHAVSLVVAPSLTPESYNLPPILHGHRIVVAPSLTPESYNVGSNYTAVTAVVAPSLTPESYNSI